MCILLYLQAAPILSIYGISKHTKMYVHFSPLSCKQLSVLLFLIPLSLKHANHTYSINTQENNDTHSKTMQQKVVAAVLKLINNQCSRHPIHLKAGVHSTFLSCSRRNTEIFAPSMLLQYL